jgi:hypothetical protein
MHENVGMEQISCSKVITPSVIQQILRILFNPTFHDRVHKSITQFFPTLALAFRNRASYI